MLSFESYYIMQAHQQLLKRLSEKARFSLWKKKDENNTVVRSATSRATTDRELEQLEVILKNMK